MKDKAVEKGEEYINKIFVNFIIKHFDLKLKTRLTKGNIKYLQQESKKALQITANIKEIKWIELYTKLELSSIEKIKQLQLSLESHQKVMNKRELQYKKFQKENEELRKCEHKGCKEEGRIRVCDTHINDDYPYDETELKQLQKENEELRKKALEMNESWMIKNLELINKLKQKLKNKEVKE